MTATLTEHERRILGVKVEAPEDLGRVISALGNAGQKGSVDYAIARRDLVHAAWELGDAGVKALPSDWGVCDAFPDGTEYKAFPAAATTIVDEEQGIVEAFVAVTGCEDKVADIIYHEAIEFALAERTPKGVAHHDWHQPIAKTEEARALAPGDPRLPTKQRDGSPWPVEAGALWVRGKCNLETQRGREAFSDMKFYKDEQEYSIGYRVPRGGAKIDKNGVRHIKQLIIPEWSPVLFGAHPLTGTDSIKHELGGRGDEAETEVEVKTEKDEKDEKDETKSGTIRVFLSGSLEERIDEITDEVEEWLQSAASGIDMTQCWGRVVGTFEDSATAGTVVFCVMTYNGYDGEMGDDTPDLDDDDNYFRAPWTIDADGECALGPVESVDIQAIVVSEPAGTETQTESVDLLGKMERKVGKMISRANMGKLKAAHGALTDLLAAAEPAAAKTENPTETKAYTAEQPHPYMAGDGKCGTCGLSDKAAVHMMNTMGKADLGDAAPFLSVEVADGADPAVVASNLRKLADEQQAKADAPPVEEKGEDVNIAELLHLQGERVRSGV